MSVASASACTICGEHTHTSRDCTDLWSDLKKGFYSGGGANRDYGGDEDSYHEAGYKVYNSLTVYDCSNSKYDGWAW